MAENRIGKRPRGSIRRPTLYQKIVGSSNIVVALSFTLKVRVHMSKIIFLFTLALILITKTMKVLVKELLISQLRS